MPVRVNIGVMVVAGLLLAANPSASRGADQKKVEWLRGSGNDLQMRLQGEVFAPDGEPAADIVITAGVIALPSNLQLRPKIDGHRFEVWIRVNQSRWYSLWLKASSAKGDRVAYRIISNYELRQAAIGGVKLTLRSPLRKVQVTVYHEGERVSNALVQADLGFEIKLRSRTDADGVARFGLLPEQRLNFLTAWTKDFRIGGFGFDRTPVRDPDANTHTIALSPCRDQKLRFVDEDGKPVPDVDFVIQMATPDPHYNYIGINENSRMTTDAAGEAVDKWFPDWDDHYFYVDLKSDEWTTIRHVFGNGDADDHRTVGDVVVFDLHKLNLADRKRVTGRVNSNQPAGGFFVTLHSFQDGFHNLQAFTDADGTFSVDVLPDAKYFAYVLDSRWVGEIVDVTPYQSTFALTNSPELSVSEGQAVEVTVTSGPQKIPIPHLTIGFQREHFFQWEQDGGTQQITTGPQWWATTDASGRLLTRTLPGKLKVRVYTPTWRTEQTVNVGKGEPVKIHLHRDIENQP